MRISKPKELSIVDGYVRSIRAAKAHFRNNAAGIKKGDRLWADYQAK